MSYTPVNDSQIDKSCKKHKDTVLSLTKELFFDLISPRNCLACSLKKQQCQSPTSLWRAYKLLFNYKKPKRKTRTECFFFRPYFTYWLLFSNTLIMCVALLYYKIAPVGTSYKKEEKVLLRHNLAYETVTYMQQENFWVGPDYEDLIHFGAKYGPCMRADWILLAMMENDKLREDGTGCCVRDDLNVCWQAHEEHCGSVFSTFHGGKVCGLSQEYCQIDELRKNRTLWEGRLSTWPNCPVSDRGNISKELYPHLACEITARPCCVGLQGECVIVSEEECGLRNGYFHENHTLCSQVNCPKHVCGVEISHLQKIYRIFLPSHINSGVIQLLITLVFLFFVLRAVEKTHGTWRTALIYTFSGCCGTVVSAFFTPYQPQVGAGGSLFGIIGLHLARDVVEIRDWHKISNIFKQHRSKKALMLLLLAVLAFIPGVMPWIDNWANLGGLIFGFILSFSIQTHKTTRGDIDWKIRISLRLLFLFIASLLTFLLLFLFYFKQDLFYGVHWPSYFNCIPFTKDFCQDSCMELRPRLGD